MFKRNVPGDVFRRSVQENCSGVVFQEKCSGVVFRGSVQEKCSEDVFRRSAQEKCSKRSVPGEVFQETCKLEDERDGVLILHNDAKPLFTSNRSSSLLVVVNLNYQFGIKRSESFRIQS